jgi:3-isopropylmalate/(R)-2-methylmalate dehydratase small subunit
VSGSLVRRVEGRGLPLPGDDIDTDRIMPARFLRQVTFSGLEGHVFEDERAAAAREGRVHPFANPAYAGASVLLVGRNFGCGSSREHAPQGLYRAGIRAVVGESFSEIFFGNALVLGLPCLTAARSDVETLMAAVEREPGASLAVDLDRLALTLGDRSFVLALPDGARQAFLSGAWDGTGLLVANLPAVRALAERLPYLAGWGGTGPGPG